jgi:hypothetical protein
MDVAAEPITLAEQAHHFQGMIEGLNIALDRNLISEVDGDSLAVLREDHEPAFARIHRADVLDLPRLGAWVRRGVLPRA